MLNQRGRSSSWKDTARGAFLRLDFPRLFPALNEALYTDVDVLFLKDPTNYRLNTTSLALAPEFDITNFKDVNTGAMLFNCKGIAPLFDEVVDFLLKNLSTVPDYDQGAIRLGLKGRWDMLSPLLNWKPYWGINKQGVLVHFHGPKPHNFLEDLSLHPDSPSIYRELYKGHSDPYDYYVSLWRSLAVISNHNY